MRNRAVAQPNTNISSIILFHPNERYTIPRRLTRVAQRLDLCVRPLDAQIVPILRLVLAPVLLLHGL
jgi:hypothetical protein